MGKICTDCKYHTETDYGYSNYTVEGTTVDCLFDLNPGLPVDRWYNNNPALDFAEDCEKYFEGDYIHLDVDRDEGSMVNYTNDEELVAIVSLVEL
jgi:hypothetical protein